MSWFDFEGHRVFYTREGAGDPIVSLPNATLTGRLWEHQVEHFRSTNDAIAVDLPGFGQSDWESPDEIKAIIAAFLARHPGPRQPRPLRPRSRLRREEERR